MTTAVAILAALAADAAAEPLLRTPSAITPIDIVMHVDVLPDHATQARNAVVRYVAAARGEPGALRIAAMQEIRQNHFDLVEGWRDEAAYRAHLSSPATLAFRRTVAPWLGSPLDERIGSPVEP